MVQDTLKERGAQYGNFHTQANITQTLNAIFMQHYNSVNSAEGKQPEPLPNFMLEALHMIFHKIGRIANGNPYNADSWHDIAGYAELVVEIIEEAQKRQAEAIRTAQAAAEKEQELETKSE